MTTLSQDTTSAAWQVFLKYSKHAQSRSAVDAKMTLSHFLSFAQDLKVVTHGAFGADGLQGLFYQHATQGTHSAIPRLDFQAFLSLVQSLGQMYKLPHIWQKVASLVQQKADPGGATDSLAQLVPELLARVQALESLLGDRPSGGVPMSVLQSIDSLQAGMQGVRSDIAQVSIALNSHSSELQTVRRELRQVQQGHAETQQYVDRAMAGSRSGSRTEEILAEMRAGQDRLRVVEAQIDSLLGTQATLTMQLTKTEDSRAAMQTELTTKLSKLTSRVDERVDELTGSQAALSMQVVKANDSRAATQQELSSKLEELRQKVEEQIDSLVGAQASCTMQLARLGDLATKLEPLTQSNLQDDVQCLRSELAAFKEQQQSTTMHETDVRGSAPDGPTVVSAVSLDFMARLVSVEQQTDALKQATSALRPEDLATKSDLTALHQDTKAKVSKLSKHIDSLIGTQASINMQINKVEDTQQTRHDELQTKMAELLKQVEVHTDSLLGTQAYVSMQLAKSEDILSVVHSEVNAKVAEATDKLQTQIDGLAGSQAGLTTQLAKAEDCRVAAEGEVRANLAALTRQLEAHWGNLTSVQSAYNTQLAKVKELRAKLEPLVGTTLKDDVQCLSSESATLRRGHVTTQGADSKATGATEGFPVSSDWQSRVEALERTIELMREAGSAPTMAEPVTKTELSSMQEELKTKVDELSKQFQQTLQRVEATSKYSVDYQVEVAIPTPNNATTTQLPSQPRTSHTGLPNPPSPLITTLQDAKRRISQLGETLDTDTEPAKRTSVSTHVPVGWPAPLTKARLSQCGQGQADGQGGEGGVGEGVDEQRRGSVSGTKGWDPAAKPAIGLLKEGGDVTAVQAARKRVQFNIETMTRDEAQEIEGRMSRIRSQIARRDMSAWDMEKVRFALAKLNSRVAALERMQKVVEQLHAIGECLEILDRRQKDQKQRLKRMDTELESVTKAANQMNQVTKDVTETLVELKLHSGSIAVLDERIAHVESLEPEIKILKLRIQQTNEDLDSKFKTLQAPVIGTRPSSPTGATAAPVRKMVHSMSMGRSSTTPGIAAAAAAAAQITPANVPASHRDSRHALMQPGETLTLDSPLVRMSTLNSNRTLKPTFMSLRGSDDRIAAAAAAAVAAAAGRDVDSLESAAATASPSKRGTIRLLNAMALTDDGLQDVDVSTKVANAGQGDAAGAHESALPAPWLSFTPRPPANPRTSAPGNADKGIIARLAAGDKDRGSAPGRLAGCTLPDSAHQPTAFRQSTSADRVTGEARTADRPAGYPTSADKSAPLPSPRSKLASGPKSADTDKPAPGPTSADKSSVDLLIHKSLDFDTLSDPPSPGLAIYAHQGPDSESPNT